VSASKSFAVYEKKHASGNVGYRVDLGLVNGKRTFKNFASREKAQEFSRKCLKAEAQKHPSLLAEIDAVTRHEVLAALARLKEYRASITDAVDFFLKHSRPVKADAPISQVIAEFKAVKEKAGLSKKYLETSARCFFAPFRDHFKDGLITDVTGEACEKYIYAHKGWNHTSRATHIRHLNVLFNFAIDKGYALLNPFEKVQRPKRQANNSADKVLSVEGVIKLLQYALTHDYKPECAALVLILFCGVRVDEVGHLTWEKIKLAEENPVVVLDQTKANHRRVNPIPPNALEWLELVRGTGKLTPPNYEGRMRWVRKAAKAGCKQNSARTASPAIMSPCTRMPRKPLCCWGTKIHRCCGIPIARS
jgi:integrase